MMNRTVLGKKGQRPPADINAMKERKTLNQKTLYNAQQTTTHYPITRI